MGSIFRKTSVREVPASAKLVSGRDGNITAKWTPRGATRAITIPVVTLDDGRQVVHVETGCFYAQYRDADGLVRTVTTRCKERGNAEQFLADLERQVERVHAGVVTADEVRRAEATKTVSIDRHIDDYIATLTGNRMHRKNTRSYLEKLRDDLDWRTLADVRRDGLDLWLAEQAGKDRSARSRNAYRVAASGFCSWLVETNRLAANPFARLAKANEKADPRRPRRALTPAELCRLIEAAQNAPDRPNLKPDEEAKPKGIRPAKRLPGRGRADLYAFLAGTGLRINEVRQLKVADLDLDGQVPGIMLRAKTTKNKDGGFIPLRADLVVMLRPHVQGKRPTQKVFNVPADLIRRFHADCKRAGIPRYDDRNHQVDLHSLRLSFGTLLALSGVPLTVTQRLMRHSDPKLTSNIYTDIRLLDLQGAVAAMPPVAPKVVAKVVVPDGTPEPSPASTGTPETEEPTAVSA
jgi:integrase